MLCLFHYICAFVHYNSERFNKQVFLRMFSFIFYIWYSQYAANVSTLFESTTTTIIRKNIEDLLCLTLC